jgi:hypothetical protein
MDNKWIPMIIAENSPDFKALLTASTCPKFEWNQFSHVRTKIKNWLVKTNFTNYN